ncbi:MULTISPECIES: hypothetical protein [unclassified Caballeronia]|uniref:hypothetical protein n=1 Tax=unclassified Caballeronia TaxID=2646786 RepID=UPI002027794D|nr:MULTISPECIES: hypothetical protein [unclassified Caballeronia]MDR5765875.1 hypothetical protein [Caballeronia sp. LZ028]
MQVRHVYRRADMLPGKVQCVSSDCGNRTARPLWLRECPDAPPPVRHEVENGELRVIAGNHALPLQGLVVSYLENRASDAIRFVAELACQEADRYMRSSQAPFAPA